MKKIFVILVLPIFFDSCIKKQEFLEYGVCNSNCQTIKGKVINQNNDGIKRIIIIKELKGSFFTSEYEVGKLYSDKDGNFETSISVDVQIDNLKFYEVEGVQIKSKINNVEINVVNFITIKI